LVPIDCRVAISEIYDKVSFDPRERPRPSIVIVDSP
jgi:hypothetical protein